jgi:membrane-bound lytic murein transglycosylase B
MLRIAFAFSATLAMFACFSSQAHAAQCGNSSAGYAAWKQEFSGEARAKGVSAATIQALMATNYAQATINADRGQRSFNLSLDQFLAKRGATTIVALASGFRSVALTRAAMLTVAVPVAPRGAVARGAPLPVVSSLPA